MIVPIPEQKITPIQELNRKQMKSKLNSRDLENIDKISDSSKLFAIMLGIMRKLRSPDCCIWDRE